MTGRSNVLREAEAEADLEDVTMPPVPWEDGAGIQLMDGRVLTFEPHSACPCADCRAAARFGYFEGSDNAE